MTGFNGANPDMWPVWNRNSNSDPAILAHWRAGADTYDIALELGLPESIIFNRLFHAREFDRIAGARS